MPSHLEPATTPGHGFFSIGVFHPKTEINVGTLWRSAYQLGASEIFTISERWTKKQASDTVGVWSRIPWRKYDDVGALLEGLPYSCPLVGIEMGGESLLEFEHPPRACYLLGAEDHGLPPSIASACHRVVALPSIRSASFNVAVAGSLVMCLTTRIASPPEKRRPLENTT